ncbi:MAG TPA: DUF4173 domain-containing protein [Caulobacter sp.]|nr:DUF4173 domain-containing protein [Caulobacter sp.]
MSALAKGRFSFWLKIALVAALVALADWTLVTPAGASAWLSVLGAAVVAAVGLAPAVRRRAWPWLVAALALAAWQAETVSRIAAAFFCLALAVAVLTPRAGAGQGVWTWTQRLLVLATGLFRAPARAFAVLGHRRMKRRRGLPMKTILTTLALPVIGGLVFLALFAAANPVLQDALSSVHGPRLEVARVVLWAILGLAAFALLRPVSLRKPIPLPAARTDARLPGVTTASVTLSLVVFNALFALQNGLDIAFLWSGARLPDDYTLAEYAHRGAYPLIVTALLAGLFVLVALAPGSETSRRPLVRALVVLWVAQNVFLVASSIQRTLLYIDSYSLTQLRLAALAWMALVAVGLVLICWRLLANRSAAWLINANAACAAAVLLAFAVVDSGEIAADWNLRHAFEADGTGVELDPGYIKRLGPSALVPLARIEQTRLSPRYQALVTALRWEAVEHTRAEQQRRRFTWRNHRRLAEADAILAAGRPELRAWRPSCRCDPPPIAPVIVPPQETPHDPAR